MLSLSHRSRGLTLVELMVTLSILAFLMIAAMPSMSQWMRNAQIRTVAEAMLNGMNKARNEAVRSNTQVFFSLVNNPNSATCTLSATSASWVVSLQSPEGACNVAAGSTSAPQPLEKWAQNENTNSITVSLSAADCTTAVSTPQQLVFNSFGRPANSSPIRCLDINHSGGTGNRALRIRVNSAGSVRMCDPAITATDDPRRC